MTSQLAWRRRWEWSSGIALAALGVGLLVIALIALRSPTGRGAAAGQTTAAPSASKSSPTASTSSPQSSPPNTRTSGTTSSAPATGKLPLVVLNNTRVIGLEAQAKARFVAGGWQVTSTGELTNDILSTCAYFDPADPAARAAAQALQAQFPEIKRVAPRFAQLPAGPIVVVLTTDYSSG